MTSEIEADPRTTVASFRVKTACQELLSIFLITALIRIWCSRCW